MFNSFTLNSSAFNSGFAFGVISILHGVTKAVSLKNENENAITLRCEIVNTIALSNNSNTINLG